MAKRLSPLDKASQVQGYFVLLDGFALEGGVWVVKYKNWDGVSQLPNLGIRFLVWDAYSKPFPPHLLDVRPAEDKNQANNLAKLINISLVQTGSTTSTDYHKDCLDLSWKSHGVANFAKFNESKNQMSKFDDVMSTWLHFEEVTPDSTPGNRISPKEPTLKDLLENLAQLQTLQLQQMQLKLVEEYISLQNQQVVQNMCIQQFPLLQPISKTPIELEKSFQNRFEEPSSATSTSSFTKND